MISTTHKTYICELLRQRKEWLQNEVKRLTLDKQGSLAIIEEYIREMELIDETRKVLSK
jgi:hypothetical protein